MFRKILSWFHSEKSEPEIVIDLSALIQENLAVLGKTSDDVARFLYAQGIVAPRRDVFKCPIACWLNRVVPSKPGYQTNIFRSRPSTITLLTTNG